MVSIAEPRLETLDSQQHPALPNEVNGRRAIIIASGERYFLLEEQKNEEEVAQPGQRWLLIYAAALPGIPRMML